MAANASFAQTIEQMLATHPRPSSTPNSMLVNCIEACMVCATSCTACADACLAEEMVKELVHCIRTDLDCADICQATGRILMRQSEPDMQMIVKQLEACQVACRRCGAVCAEHAKMHEHCRVCAEACRACEQACAALLAAMPA